MSQHIDFDAMRGNGGRNDGGFGFCPACSATGCVIAQGAADSPQQTAGLRGFNQQRFVAGETLALSDISSDMVTVIALGMARIEWIHADGRRQVLDFRQKNDELCAPGDLPDLRAVAVTPGILYRMSTQTYALCRGRFTSVAEWAATVHRSCLDRLTRRTVMLGRLTARERICAFFLELAGRSGDIVHGGTMIQLPMSREDIADYLGLNAETVSRLCSRLKAAGLIHMTRPSEVVIPDLGRLRAVAPV